MILVMSENQEILVQLKELNTSMKSLSERVQKLETKEETPAAEQESQGQDQDGAAEHVSSPHNPNVRASVDIQRDFENIKDSLSKVPLPTQYKVNDSSRGIKQEAKSTLSVISKCARFAETGLKIVAVTQPLSEDEHTVTIEKEHFQKLFTIYAAQVNFLQGEFAGLVVRNTFDEETVSFISF